MAPKPSTFIPILFMALILATSTTISAFNITRLFDNHPEFSTFNDLLSKTGVATAINNRKTITVLALDNSAVGPISSQPPSSQKYMLATHVVLDYYDTTKLGDLKEATQLTTLFQSSGIAAGQQGFIKVTTDKDGNFIFYSAVKGAPHNTKMVKSVAFQPYSIAVLQINQPIYVPGLNQTPISSPSTSSPSASPVAPPPKDIAPAPAADGPTDDSVADGPEADGPTAGSSPAPSPDLAPEDAPADDEPPAKLAPTKNGGGRVMVGGGLVGVFMGFMALAL